MEQEGQKENENDKIRLKEQADVNEIPKSRNSINIADLENKESKLREQIEEAKSWSQVVNGSRNKQKGIIEQQIKIQIKEEQDKIGKVANIIIKGIKDFGEMKRTDILVRDFLRDKLEWT